MDARGRRWPNGRPSPLGRTSTPPQPRQWTGAAEVRPGGWPPRRALLREGERERGERAEEGEER
eukprot:13081305-Alexandrium_andersonii.AAC.1